ncbi:MAG: hypothetical protein ACHQET_09480 [Chitinophagales bacterium]
MQRYLEQAQRNEELHGILCTNHPDRFFNWKIMALHYSAFHYLKALAAKKNIEIGDTQHAIDKSCNPDNNSTLMPLQKDVWLLYEELQRQFRDSIYSSTDGNHMINELKGIHGHCLEHLDSFKKYAVKELFG